MFVQWLVENIPLFLLQNGEALALVVVGYAVEKHYVSRVSTFSNSIAIFYYFVRSVDGIHPLLDYYIAFGLLMGLVGIVSYIKRQPNLDEDYYHQGLPQWYYSLSWLYCSVVAALIILGFGTELNKILWVWFPS